MDSCRPGALGLLAVLALAVVLGAGGTAAAASPTDQPTFIWWEAEQLADTNLPDPDAPFPGNISPAERGKLSGGRWLMTSGPPSETPYFVTYQVEVPREATYDFWVRKFWKHGPFRWRFDEGQWQECGRRIALHGHTHLRKHIGTNWVFLGRLPLGKGDHKLRIEMLEEEGGGAVDCFLLIDGPFVPRGKLKPGRKSGRATPGFFPWEPDADPLLASCPIDLRRLNEEEAGQDGFVKRQGGGFVLGSGRPVRFWMVQGGSLMAMKDPMVDYWARRLAKYGVNMVRLGMLGMFNDWKAGNAEAFQRKLDRLHYVVSALKREGIYVYLGHLFWHTSVQVSEEDGFPGYGDGKTAYCLLFFDPKMRSMYLEWVDALVNAPNPYTGLPLSRDPAVAIIEIQNESNLFWWSFRPEALVPQTRALMEQRFAEWAAEKYGSVGEALEAWGPQKPPVQFSEVSKDAPEEGRLGLYPIGNLT
ncbi:MAG: hypothetical protein R6V05_02145, partial [Candidatus Brocadiia bacterium]